MREYMNNLKSYTYLMWLGGGVYYIFGVSVLDWRYWALLVPAAVLETVTRFEREQG